ncbi:phasin family protein [Rhodoferax sp.]|uniref:phasin family protein n=1 Tax=Rhodoferax sp. TaxID=50421 RepID=UPI0026290DCC|nr:phasin family protein [Rhodoferax sp.]MDD4945126.1 phasin family protein [Rhodoferax sp.]MDD5481267.1 phasin family protein [Rhodoferax sp.]
MVTKLKKSTPSTKSASKASAKAASQTSADLSGTIKDSAQQIWQAGLGAFMKAQAGGTKAFEALVKEGVTLQRKTQSAAEEKITEAAQKMTSMATDLTSKASGQWDKLESIFEDRVAKALNKLGVPSAQDIDDLMARMDALNASVQQLAALKTAAKPGTQPKAAPVAKATKKSTLKPATKPTTKAAVKAATNVPPETAPGPTKQAPRKPAARKTAAKTVPAAEPAAANPA